MNFSELEQKINENKQLDFGDIFNKSIELFKKTWQQGLLHMLLSVAVILAVMAIIMIPMFVMGVFDPSEFESLGGEPNFAAIITMYLVLFPAIFVASALSMLLNAAFYRIVKQIDLGEPEANSFFRDVFQITIYY